MISKTKLFYLFVLFTILNFQCETVENRLEYFISERMKETETVQKICEDFENLNLNKKNQYIDTIGKLKEKFEKSRTDILKNSIRDLKLESGKINGVELENLGSLLVLSEIDKKRFSNQEKLEWEEKYRIWQKNKKEVLEKMKEGKDISKELEILKQGMIDVVNLKDNLVYALKLYFTQALVVAIVHNANEAEKSLDKHTNKLGSVGIIAEAIGREIITEVMAQLVEILIPYIEKKELINPIDLTRESCKIYHKYETTPGIANRILKRSILRFLKPEGEGESLVQVYSLNNINGLQNESELGTTAGLKKLEDKKREVLRKISNQNLFSNSTLECKSTDCKNLSENIQKDSILPAIPSENLKEKLIASYDKCLEPKEKCETETGAKNKETILTASIERCLKEKGCDWDFINQDVSWRIWHDAPSLARLEDFIFLKAKFFENSFRTNESDSSLLAKIEELQGTIRILRNDIVQSMNASCAGQLEQQRNERVGWLKKLQASGFTIDTKSKVELTANNVCSLGDAIGIKKEKLVASVTASSICSFQPIEINLEIKGLFGACEFKSPDDEKLALETMNLLEILRNSLGQSSIQLQVIGFTDEVDATFADCQKKIQSGLSTKDPAIQASLKDCPKPCEGNLALSNLRAFHFRNYLSSKEKLFNGQISYNAYGLSKLDAIDKSSKDLNRRIKLKVFAANSKYGCY
ncbi:MAG TPA: hypothetical protein PLS71_23950 [Leptospiraceae bacterium]|nr:hypothetical protein [Leptospiraceae bacterium]